MCDNVIEETIIGFKNNNLQKLKIRSFGFWGLKT